MLMSSRVRKFALTVHVVSSVGWIGAAFVFLAHAVIGLTSREPSTVRAVYMIMEPAAWLTLVPLSLASLFTGLVQSVGSAWGLFKHYWVVAKLAIAVFATVILLIYMRTFTQMAAVAADQSADLAAVRNASPLVHAALAIGILLAATALSIYKPRGLTWYGRRVSRETSNR